ncbi:class I SAM-dependent methyltransferase [Brevibacterium sp. LS14]|uniref:methyltransferase domain-containing protein n=1 Tax=Brevibacterium sp. LS14 TaxID=2528962 RepID=UPI0014319D9F|nr:class I SAM-dependent methyltransferase [Brevibacterium sp. LS14]
MEPHTDRARAESFGPVADQYDRYRPRYPKELLTAMLEASSGSKPRLRALDVGAGTGILAMQLRERGCDVLAVEPDPGMAAVAAGKGLHVETAKFEQWDPSGREFDIVAFGQSFHWVDPVPALSRIRKILTPSGTLALAWNRIVPQGPPARRIDETLDEYLPQQDRSSGEVDSEGAEQDGPAPLVEVLRRNSFDVEELHFEESLRYAPEAWLSMVATHSDQLTTGTEDRLALHTALRDALGQDVLETQNHALLLVAKPRR